MNSIYKKMKRGNISEEIRVKQALFEKIESEETFNEHVRKKE